MKSARIISHFSAGGRWKARYYREVLSPARSFSLSCRGKYEKKKEKKERKTKGRRRPETSTRRALIPFLGCFHGDKAGSNIVILFEKSWSLA